MESPFEQWHDGHGRTLAGYADVQFQFGGGFGSKKWEVTRLGFKLTWPYPCKPEPFPQSLPRLASLAYGSSLYGFGWLGLYPTCDSPVGWSLERSSASCGGTCPIQRELSEGWPRGGKPCRSTTRFLAATYYLLLAVYYLLLTTYYLLLLTTYHLLHITYYLQVNNEVPGRFLLLTTCCLLLTTHHSYYLLLLTTYSSLLTTYHWLLTTDYWLLTTCYLLLTTYYYWLLTTYYLLPITYYLQVNDEVPGRVVVELEGASLLFVDNEHHGKKLRILTTHSSLLTTHYLLLTTYSRLTHYSLLTTHCLLGKKLRILTTYSLLTTHYVTTLLLTTH